MKWKFDIIWRGIRNYKKVDKWYMHSLQWDIKEEFLLKSIIGTFHPSRSESDMKVTWPDSGHSPDWPKYKRREEGVFYPF